MAEINTTDELSMWAGRLLAYTPAACFRRRNSVLILLLRNGENGRDLVFGGEWQLFSAK